jgi:hypothetical protein
MSHSSTELLIDYWQSRISGPGAPTRASIDPSDFPKLLPQVFMLGRRGPGDYVFRLAGGFVGDLHQLDLRGVAFSKLWTETARIPLQTALEGARHRVAPVRIVAEAQGGPNTLGLNMVVLPLANASGEVDRYLGLYEPMAPVSTLRGIPAYRLQLITLGAMTIVNESVATEEPRLRLASVGGRRVG